MSLQGTLGAWTDVEVLWTKADEGDAEFYQLSYNNLCQSYLKISKNFLTAHFIISRKCPTIVPGRLRSEPYTISVPFEKNDEFINNSVPFLKYSVPKILYRTRCQIFNKIKIRLTPQWQSSERNLLVTIVQKMDIFYSGILNLEFPNFFFNF